MRSRVLFVLFAEFLFVSTAFSTTRLWNFSVQGHVTRCFEVKDIKARCEDFSQPEQLVFRKELQIEATDFRGRKYAYDYGKAIEGPLCRDHLRKIGQVLRNAGQACITGDDEIKLDTGETYARWVGIETRNGEVVW